MHTSDDSRTYIKNKVAIAGVTGYSGGELARLVLNHPRLAGIEPVFYGREGEPSHTTLEEIHPALALGGGSAPHKIHPLDWGHMCDSGVEVLFLATPHEQSRGWVPTARLCGMKVIDLSGAWRLQEDAN
ncbi:MAG: hypothetical protein FWD64_09230, partial [Acidobacteriaceae bacterium]|nr:hypothetical protein [Acidobacteriaceae bacterium]